MAQWLRVLAALPQYPTPESDGSQLPETAAPLASVGPCTHLVFTHTYTHSKVAKINIKKYVSRTEKIAQLECFS